jgi:hypothetical protein
MHFFFDSNWRSIMVHNCNPSSCPPPIPPYVAPFLSIRNNVDISIDVHDAQESDELNDPLYCVTNDAVKVDDAIFSITSDTELPA